MKTMSVVALFLICICLALVSAQTINFEKIDLTVVNPNAVCNDGSPAVYYFRPGYGSGSSVFTIYLEGGGVCYGILFVIIILILNVLF